MKEIYFSKGDIQQTAQRMLESVEKLRARHLPLDLPERSALLVLDMQNYFLDPGSHAFIPSAPAVIPGIKRLIAAFEGRGQLVLFTRHINDPSNAGMMAVWWKDLIQESSPLSRISAELPAGGRHIVNKSQYDAFAGSLLGEVLESESIKHVVVCGVMTHLCCETTARSAFVRGYKVWFTIDGCATYNRDFHQASLLNLAHGFAVPVLVNEVLVLREND